MPIPRARWWWPLMVGVMLASCRSDPSDPQYWVKEVDAAKRPQDRVRVLEDLRKSTYLSPAFLPALHEQLAAQKSPEVKAALARILGQLKDPSSAKPLIDALDIGGSGSAADRMNREIAAALGGIGDPQAVPVLLQLLGVRDPFVQLQAIEALGQLKAKAAVGPLLALAEDESKEALVASRAITSLGEIGDPTVISHLVRLMFQQRGRSPLYEAAAFALYHLGKPASSALLGVLSGSDSELWQWAKQHHIAPAAVYSKSSQVLGYMLEPRAETLLLAKLSFKNEDETQQSYVRLTAAESLGRLRSKAAAKQLIPMLSEEELVVRGAYLRALGRIGDKEAVPALSQAASKGMWEQRAPVLETLALLADPAEVANVESLAKGEAERVKQECAASESTSSLCKTPDQLTQRRTEVYTERIAELKAAQKCQEQTPCWTQALEDPGAGVRARAALILGRAGQASAVGPLLKHIGDSDREARLAIIQAADWLTQSSEGVTAAKSSLPALEAQVTQDEGKSDWVEASDNLRRLIVKLKRP